LRICFLIPAPEVEVAVVQERRLALKFLEVKSICRYRLTV
jgi:hypothetical protein